MKNPVLFFLTLFIGIFAVLLFGIRHNSLYLYDFTGLPEQNSTISSFSLKPLSAAQNCREEAQSATAPSSILVPLVTYNPVNSCPGFTMTEGSALVTGETGSLSAPKELSIHGLDTEDTPPLDQGMVNVTGEHSAFRMLPHGEFEKDITVVLPYDTSLIPAGYSEREIYTYYYNESLKRWMMLKRDSVDMEQKLVVSKVNHFTDFVNAIIKTPEMPETQAYTPTSIKDLKAADPLEGFHLPSVPLANSRGTANLSYPLDLPVGRQGMQPALTLRYNSGGGDSWTGIGWDLSISSISIDTRWGVPHYSQSKESETYLLDGEQLATKDAEMKYEPAAHHTAWVSRKNGDIQFYPRVEGAFNKIVRHGSSPKNYWWEVIDKEGIRYFYGKKFGQDGMDPNGVLTDHQGNVARWCLTEVRDPYNNFIYYGYTYDYGETGGFRQQIYPDYIQYTGHGVESGIYRVEFTRILRQDETSSGRSGLYEANRYLLREVKTLLNTQGKDWEVLKRYFFCYEHGSFGKSRLTGFSEVRKQYLESNDLEHGLYQSCKNSKVMLPLGEFNYYDAPSTLYGDEVTVSAGIDDAKGLVSPGRLYEASSIGGTKGSGWDASGTLALGFGFQLWKKNLTGGGTVGGGRAKSEGLLTLIDLDGDGLPDKLFKSKSDGKIYYRKQNIDPNTGVSTFGPAKLIGGIDHFLKEESRTFFWGMELNVNILGTGGSASFNRSKTRSATTAYFSDVDADGLPDIVSNGLVHFNRLDSQGVPYFIPISSGETIWVGGSCGGPVSLGSGVNPGSFSVNDTVITCTLDYKYNQPLCCTTITRGVDIDTTYYSPDHESVRCWKAPYNGKITIGGAAVLTGDLMDVRRQSGILDGVKVTVQLGDNVLTSSVLAPDYRTSFTPNLQEISVNRGMRLYFRVESGSERLFDRVSWTPEIRYTHYRLNPNENPAYIPVSEQELSDHLTADQIPNFLYNAEQDFLIAGNQSIELPYTGFIKIENRFSIDRKLSENLTMHIIKMGTGAGSNVSIPAFYPKGQIVPESVQTQTLMVNQGDRIFFYLTSQAGNVDWSAVNWTPKMYYDVVADEGVEAYETESNPGVPTPTIVYYPLPNFNAYQYARYPSAGWKAVNGGTAVLVPQITISGIYPVANDTIVLTVKNTAGLIASQKIPVSFNQLMPTSFIPVNMSAGETYWFDYYTNNTDLADKITVSACNVNGVSVPAGFYSRLSGNNQIMGYFYRGWGQFTYLKKKGETRLFESRLRIPLEIPESEEEYEEGDNPYELESASDIDTSDLERSFAERGVYNPIHNEHFIVMTPDNGNKRWMSLGGNTYVTADTMSNCLPEDIEVDESGSPIPVVIPGTKVLAIKKRSFNYGKGKTLVGSFLSEENTGTDLTMGVSRVSGYTVMEGDFIDLNGDRYPDVIGSYIQYSQPQGGLNWELTPLDTRYGRIDSSAYLNRGANYGASFFKSTKESKNDKKYARYSASGGTGVSYGSDACHFTFIDINGDGLPDKVNPGLYGTAQVNLGYIFRDHLITNTPIGVRKNTSVTGNISLGAGAEGVFNKVETSISGGYGQSFSDNKGSFSLLDINGDGIPDKVYVKDNQVYVDFNWGVRFSGIETLLLEKPQVERSKSINGSINGAITFGALVCPFVKLVVNPHANKNWSVNQTLEQFIDMNGDGYPDYVTSDANGVIKIRYNLAGKANLLKSAQNIAGGKFTVDYELTASSYQCPQRLWVMASVRSDDGCPGDGQDQTLATFSYENPYYDRYEREQFGFAVVVTKERNTADNNKVYRVLTEKYYNDAYKTKGLKYEELLTDNGGKKYIEKLFYWLPKEIETGKIIDMDKPWCYGESYPALNDEIVNYYEGGEKPGITTQKTYHHGAFGNIIRYDNYGDKSFQKDDLSAEITYHQDTQGRHIVGKPASVRVLDYNNWVIRYRETDIDEATGKPLSIRVYTDENNYAEMTFKYDQYGNVFQRALPPNKSNQHILYTYTYDNKAHAYPVNVFDIRGYSSQTDYDYRYGRPSRTTDLNGNVIEYEYDHRGRLFRVRIPHEEEYILQFRYMLDGMNEQGGYYDYTLPAWATTAHYDSETPDNPIETALITDGFGRVVQTKKDIELEGAERRQVEGKKIYDAFGRVVRSFYPVTENLSVLIRTLNTSTDPVAPTEISYDILDRKTEQILPDGSVTQMKYSFGEDAYGVIRFTTTTTDANGIEIQTCTDPRGLLTTIYAPEKAVTRFAYGSYGELRESVDPEEHITSYQYNMAGQRVSRSHPDSRTTEWKYDLAGNTIAVATSNLSENNEWIEYDYDYNLLTGIRYPQHPENNVTYRYGAPDAPDNGRGRIVFMEDATGYQTFKYGKLGEVVENKRTFVLPYDENSYTFTMDWEYDHWNRIKEITYPDGEKVHYTYNQGGLLRGMRGEKRGEEFAYINDIRYNKFEAKTSIVYGNDTEAAYEYDVLQRLSALTSHTSQGLLMQKLDYTYDPVSNITRITNRGDDPGGLGGWYEYDYSYDDLYRLTNSEGAWDNGYRYNLKMEYTPDGKISRKGQSYEGNLGHGDYDNHYEYYPEKPHAIRKLNDGQYFEWDRNGNMNLHGKHANFDMRRLCWDEENRLSGVADDSYSSFYYYDAGGERTVKLSGYNKWVDVNGVQQGFAELHTPTLYTSPYLVASQKGYTKHYYIENQRIVSKLGGGDLRESEEPVVSPEAVFEKQKRLAQLLDATAECLQISNLNALGLSDKYCGHKSWLPVMCRYEELVSAEKELYFYHPDHLGSSSWITDLDGLPVQHLSYLPFGEEFVDQRTSDWNAAYKFTGKEKDEETGYNYFGARYYMSDLGVWASVDPLSDKYPSLSAYNYCALNPIKLVDPNGMEIVNGYEASIAVAKERKKIAQSALDAFGGNKKADGYKTAKKELNAANRQMGTAERNYSQVQSAIKDLYNYNRDLYNTLDNLQDESGHTVDVHVTLNGNLPSQGRDGQVIENMNPVGLFYNFSEAVCISCIVMELDPKAADLGQILSHEGGHGLYDVQNAKSYFKWQKNMGLDYPGYGGHHPEDPSGKEAKRQEDIYIENRRKNPSGR